MTQRKRLDYLEIRNPKLPDTKLVPSVAEQLAPTIGLSLSVAIFGFIVMIPIMVGLDAAFLGGVGLDGDDEITDVTAWLSVIGGALFFGLAFFMAQFGLPKMYPPVEFDTHEKKEAYGIFRGHPREVQLELKNAYRAFMNSDGSRASEPYRIWYEITRAINERTRLQTPPPPEDPFLEEARHDLKSVLSEIEHYKELK